GEEPRIEEERHECGALARAVIELGAVRGRALGDLGDAGELGRERSDSRLRLRQDDENGKGGSVGRQGHDLMPKHAGCPVHETHGTPPDVLEMYVWLHVASGKYAEVGVKWPRSGMAE